jgi:8-oxo-dGTP diphosphatase
MFVFDGGILDAARAAEIQLPDDELRSWAWCTPVEGSARLSALLARRVSVAVLASRRGDTVYLEDGEPIL